MPHYDIFTDPELAAVWRQCSQRFHVGTGSADEAADLYQDLCARVWAWQQAGGVPTEADHFLRVSTTRLLIDRWRALSRSPWGHLAEDQLGELILALTSDSSSHDELSLAELCAAVRARLQALFREGSKSLVILLRWEEPVAVVAAAIGSTPDSVRQLRLKLRQRLLHDPVLRSLSEE